MKARTQAIISEHGRMLGQEWTPIIHPSIQSLDEITKRYLQYQSRILCYARAF